MTDINKPAFRQPIRFGGPDTGVAATQSLSEAMVSQRAPVSAGLSSSTQIARLGWAHPGTAHTTDIYGFQVDLITGTTDVSAADTALQIGTSGDSTYFGRIKVSGAGRYLMTTAHASAGGRDKWFGITAETSVFAVVSAGGSGASWTGTGYITTLFTPR